MGCGGGDVRLGERGRFLQRNRGETFEGFGAEFSKTPLCRWFLTGAAWFRLAQNRGDGMLKQRLVMAAIGAVAGGSFYLLALATHDNLISGRLVLFAVLLVGLFFTGLLAMIGPLSVLRAAAGALAVALAVTLLFLWASFRFEVADDAASAPLPLAALLVLATLPWPFVIAGRGWRDYPVLFGEAWGIAMRGFAAAAFVGLVWALIYLSDALLQLVGIKVIGQVLAMNAVPPVLTGTVAGLGLAVVLELSGRVTPYLVLRLLRLLVPVVLVVLVVFMAALPVRGLSGLFGGFSSAAVLVAIAGAAATLVTATVDQDDDAASASSLLLWAARGLAGITILPAGLAVWAIWLRVATYGWTPDRLLGATVAVLALGYGMFYLVAALMPGGWMERIRQGNILMALAMIGVAALWLTPVLNPEAIASASQMGRIASGKTKVEAIDVAAFQDWGVAGAVALAELKTRADGGDTALAQRLAGGVPDAAPPDPQATAKALAGVLPLQPATPEAAALRDRILALTDPYEMGQWQADCGVPLPQGGAGCVLLVADFLPAVTGLEALLIARSGDGLLTTEGFAIEGGLLRRHALTSYDGDLPDFESGAALIAALQKAMPVLAPLPLNQIAVPGQPGLAFGP